MNILLKNFDSHISSFPSRTKGMVVIKKSNLTVVDSGLDSDTFNIIHILNGHHISDREIENAVNRYEDHKRKYTIWIAKNQLNEKVKSILASLDFNCLDSTPGMKLDLTNYRPATDSSMHDIRVLTSAEDLQSYARLIADQWKPRDENVISYYHRISGMILENKLPIQFALYFKNGAPVAGVEMCITTDTMGIYGLATLESYRKQGIGTALTNYTLACAKTKNLGATVLQSSDSGYGIYKRLGFKVMTEYFEYGRK